MVRTGRIDGLIVLDDCVREPIMDPFLDVCVREPIMGSYWIIQGIDGSLTCTITVGTRR